MDAGPLPTRHRAVLRRSDPLANHRAAHGDNVSIGLGHCLWLVGLDCLLNLFERGIRNPANWLSDAGVGSASDFGIWARVGSGVVGLGWVRLVSRSWVGSRPGVSRRWVGSGVGWVRKTHEERLCVWHLCLHRDDIMKP